MYFEFGKLSDEEIHQWLQRKQTPTGLPKTSGKIASVAMQIEQDETVSQASQNNKVKNMNLHHQPELQFTLEDSDLVDKLHDTLSSATMNLVRQELIQGVVDMVMGEISHEELLSILKRGRSRQNLLHTTIMSSLPFYTDLSTK